MQKKQADEEMLREAFARLDEDGSGTLDKKEVRPNAVPLPAAQHRCDARAPALNQCRRLCLSASACLPACLSVSLPRR